MAAPIKLTQAKALLAVLSGGAATRRERVYYLESVLRSSVYGVPSKDGVYVGPIQENTLSLFTGYKETSSTGAVFLDLISLKESLNKYIAINEPAKISGIELSDLTLIFAGARTVTLNEADTSAISGLILNSLSLKKALIRHVEPIVHATKTSSVQLDSITLTVG